MPGRLNLRRYLPRVVCRRQQRDAQRISRWSRPFLHDGSPYSSVTRAPIVEPLEDRRLLAALVEVGTNDFRISEQGPNSNGSLDAVDPAVAYNATNDEYLVVWSGDDNMAPLADGEFEVYCQIVDANDGSVVIDDFRISFQGLDGVGTFDASNRR